MLSADDYIGSDKLLGQVGDRVDCCMFPMLDVTDTDGNGDTFKLMEIKDQTTGEIRFVIE